MRTARARENMILHGRIAVFAMLLCLIVLSACGGSRVDSGQAAIPAVQSPGLPVPAPSPSAAAQSAVTFTYAYALTVPASAGSAALAHTQRRFTMTTSNFNGYTSTAAPISMTLNVTPVGGTTTGYAGTCTAVASGLSGTCTVVFSAAPGPATFAGTLKESGNTVAVFSQLQIILPNTANAINFTANPVVASVSLQLAATTIDAGTAQDVALTVNAADANGNIIAGNAPYVDANGKPVAFVLSVTNSQAGGQGTAVLKGPARVTAPNQQAIFVHYDGRWLDHANIQVSSTSGAVASLAGTTLSTKPHVFEYAAAGNPFAIAVGADGNLWFTESSGNSIGRITPQGTNYTAFHCGACNLIGGIAAGPDGNLWFNEYNAAHVDKITTAGVITRVVGTPGADVCIIAGPDGNLWSTTDWSGNFGRVSTSGSASWFGAGGQVRGCGVGPDGNLWFSVWSNGTVIKANTAGTVLGTYSAPTLGGECSDGVITGPDQNVWLVSCANDAVIKSTVNGAVSSYPLQAGASPRDLAAGPDGEIWISEENAHCVGRIKTDGTGLIEYCPAGGYGIGATAKPGGITVGPDGNIWFVEENANTVAKLVL